MDRVLLFTGVLGLLVTGTTALDSSFVIGRDAYLTCGALITRHFRRRPIDVVYIGKIAAGLSYDGVLILLLGMPWWTVWVLYVFHGFRFSIANRVFSILFVYVGILFSAELPLFIPFRLPASSVQPRKMNEVYGAKFCDCPTNARLEELLIRMINVCTSFTAGGL